MNRKHNYQCSIIMGNMAIIETEMYKEGFLKFMESLNCKSYTIEKVEDPYGNFNYYYEAEIKYQQLNFLKVLRFSEVVNSYARYHNHTLREDILD